MSNRARRLPAWQVAARRRWRASGVSWVRAGASDMAAPCAVSSPQRTASCTASDAPAWVQPSATRDVGRDLPQNRLTRSGCAHSSSTMTTSGVPAVSRPSRSWPSFMVATSTARNSPSSCSPHTTTTAPAAPVARRSARIDTDDRVSDDQCR